MKTDRYPLAIAAFLVAILFASCPGRTEPKGEEQAAETPSRALRTATVAFVEGTATVDGSPVEPGDDIGRKFVVRTEPGARLDIVFDGLNALSIGQNAFVEIDLASVAPRIRLERGGVTSVLKKLEKLASGDSFTVLTAQSVMGVRGTSFCIWADASSTYVCACNGEVRTIDAKGNNEETLASAHHVARIYSPKDGTISVGAAGMLHHDDASVESVASRIGYTIDWTRIDR